MISRRRLLQAAAAGIAGCAGAGLYAWRVEPHWLEVVHRPLSLAGLPADLEGTLLVQLSDLHIGPRVDDSYLRRCFGTVRALHPDFVVYTGDFTSHEPDLLEHATGLVPHLPLGRRGTFGVLGNHDYGPRWSRFGTADRIAAMAAAAGVRILRNEVAESHGLHVAGLDDLWAGRFDPVPCLPRIPASGAALALSHNPDTVDRPGWDSYTGWILSGHTHGGQCKAPFLPPPLLPVRNRRYTAGEFALNGGRRLYINRGLGHLLAVRFNARPEATVFHLTRA